MYQSSLGFLDFSQSSLGSRFGFFGAQTRCASACRDLITVQTFDIPTQVRVSALVVTLFRLLMIKAHYAGKDTQ
jgi:hypothetical protein